MMNFEWENIRCRWSDTYRAKVHGGWLVKEMSHSIWGVFFPIGIAICFVPDPNHKWEI